MNLQEAIVSANSLTDWLLETSIPSIRYFTLRNLLDRPEDDADVHSAREAIMQTGPVPVILAKQTTSGQWADEYSYYTPKYVSTHWSMMLLVELAARPDDPRLQQGADFMLKATQERAVSSHAPEQQDMGCFWGNELRYLAYCNRADDPRAAEIIETLVLASQGRGWGCHINAELACAWGAVRALWGLAGLPDHLRTPDITAAIESGVQFIFGGAYSLPDGNYPTPGAVHKNWSKLNFPLFYQADILFVLRVAAELGVLDRPQAQAGLQWLKERRQANGRWRGTSPYSSRTWRALGGSAESSRWVSLQAALVLKSVGELN
jgi:hypothetical protein